MCAEDLGCFVLYEPQWPFPGYSMETKGLSLMTQLQTANDLLETCSLGMGRPRSVCQHLVTETKEMFWSEGTQEIIKKLVKECSWCQDILDGVREAEGVRYSCPDFVIVDDMLRVNRSSLKVQFAKMNMLVLFRSPALRCIRDLNRSHVRMLQSAAKEAVKCARHILGVDSNDIALYFHYYPGNFRLHMHVAHVRERIEVRQIHRIHFLDEIISNLDRDTNYYRDADLRVWLPSGELAYGYKRGGL